MSFRLAIGIVAVVLVFPVTSSGGRYAGDFLDIGVGGRALGMGGAFVALANDGSAAFFNPAGFGQLEKKGITLMHTWLFMGMANYDFLSFAGPVGDGLGIGLSLVRLGVDEIPIFPELSGTPDERRDSLELRPDGTPLGYFQDAEYAAYLSVGKAITYEFGKGVRYVAIPIFICIGGNAKYLHQSLKDKTGTGIGVDLGAIFAINLRDIFTGAFPGRLSLGVDVMDIGGTKITWNTRSQRADEIPFNFRYGASLSQEIDLLRGEVTLAWQADTRYEQKNSYGAEYSLLKKVAVRAGYTGSDLTLGAGVSGPYNSTLDYAFMNHQLDNTHRVSFALWF